VIAKNIHYPLITCGGVRGTVLNIQRGGFYPSMLSANIASIPDNDEQLVFACATSISQNHEVLASLLSYTTHISDDTPIPSDDKTKNYVCGLLKVYIRRR